MFFKALQNTHIKFIGMRKVAMAFSTLLIVGSLVLFFTKGLNYGIDFKGGISIEIGTKGPMPLDKVRAALDPLSLGDFKVQTYGDKGTEAKLRIERQPGDAEAQNAAVDKVKTALAAAISDISIREYSVIGPSVSEELKQDGFISVTVAVFMVLVYIWLRFEWQFGLGAVIALVHDVVLTVGFFSLTGIEFNLSIIAAILTIVGYSLNDTVVVYDRVRENIRRFRKMELEEILDTSLNQTLSRTLMTSLTTLLALFALFFLGGPALEGFSDAMIWGVVVGTYSSVFIASPILLMLDLDTATMIPEDHSKDPTVDKGPLNPFENI